MRLGNMAADDDFIAAQLLALVDGRDTSVCPSEVARALAPDDDAWRPLMARVRAVAAALQAAGAIGASQGGVPVDAGRARGPIRLHAPR